MSYIKILNNRECIIYAVVLIPSFIVMDMSKCIAAVPVKGGGIKESLDFDSDFLSMVGGGEKHVDLSYFAYKGGMAPGDYTVKVIVNGKLVDENRRLEFRSRTDQPGKLYACVNSNQLAEWWGIIASNEGRVSPEYDGKDKQINFLNNLSGALRVGDYAQEDVVKPTCPMNGVSAMVNYAKEEFDFNKRTLSLTVPQASLGPSSMLRTPPHLWDEGIPAIIMNYNYSGSKQNSERDKGGSDVLGLNGQMNILGWRIRNDLTWSKSQRQGADWNASQIFAQRDFSAARGGQLTVGYTTSNGGGLSTVPFAGIRVDSDEAMLDPKYTTYRPAITGIANSPATVTVRQYGKIIYQQNVPQGQFSLTDFNRSGNGDVDVEIRDAQGRTQSFILAQASNSILLPKGRTSWSVSSGRALNSKGYANDKFLQAGSSYGAWENTTLTGGTLISENYQALSLGTGVYKGIWGAATFTVRTSRADTSVVPGYGGVKNGLSYETSWSRSFGDTSAGASWSHAQTRNFFTYGELLSIQPLQQGDKNTSSEGQRESYSLYLSHNIGAWGNLSLNGTRSTTWGNGPEKDNISLSYNTTVSDVGIGVSLGYSTMYGSNYGAIKNNYSNSTQRETDRSIAVNISLPLGKWLYDSSMSGNYSYSAYNGTVSQQAGVSGSSFNGDMYWSASQSLNGTKNGNASAGYSGRLGAVNGGYSYGGGRNSISYGLNGGIALHPHGVTLGRQLSLNGANAIVETSGLGGIGVNGTVTDWRGYALVSGLSPYDSNSINVDMNTMPGSAELDATSKNIIPKRGALVAVKFRGNKGYRLIINLNRMGGDIPFGSTVSLQNDNEDAVPVTGIVGDSGQVYMSGMPQQGTIKAIWGYGENDQCKASYVMASKANMEVLNEIEANCQ